jgi:uncharacterized protein YkwD
VESRPDRTAQASPLIAPPAVCPGQSRLDAPAPVQEQAMLCMANFARARLGLEPLSTDTALAQSAAAKAGDILGCDAFSHFACGREFYYWIREAGYLTGGCVIGENIAWGKGAFGTVGSIFRAWMRSQTHRENILQPGVRVWVQHFGGGCEGAPA